MGIDVTQYDLVKSLFLAERGHLNKFGRPITFDNYVAMRHGPVPSLAYDLLKKNRITMQKYGVKELPWLSAQAEHLGQGCMLFTASSVSSEGSVLSPSDIEALRNALIVVSSLTFGQIRELTHGDAAYKEAWRDGESQNAPMSLGLLFDTPDFVAAEEIRLISQLTSDSEGMSDVEVDNYFSQFETG